VRRKDPGRRARLVQAVLVVAALVVAGWSLPAPASAGPMTMQRDQPRSHPMPGRKAMPMVEATAPDSFTIQALQLPTTGWTATASDQSVFFPASNVLDNNMSTFWHSNYGVTMVPLPHTITIDVKSSRGIAGLLYTPRQDAPMNGTVGRYTVTMSSDGVHFGEPVATGTWADDKRQKTATFPATKARYVRLTTLSEAGGRGPWSSAAEIGLLADVAAADPPLPRTGWTATASDAFTANPAKNVLDGNAGTIWHSNYSPNVPLPHSITIDTGATRAITGLTYLPRQDAPIRNGTIGAYTISVSTDGTSWGSPVAQGSWADDRTAKTVTFASRHARYVRLTGTSEAGNRGPWSSAAELDLLGPGAGGGSWGPALGLPLVPVSAVVLPHNKLLTFAAVDTINFSTSGSATKVSIIDLDSTTVGQVSTVNTGHEMFCTGLAILADGRVLINGGSSDSATTIYDPATNTWTAGPKMNIPRGYNSSVTLSDGRVLTLGGSGRDSKGGKDGEVFTLGSGTGGNWTQLPGVSALNIQTADPDGVFRSDNHAWLFAVPGGGAFQAGPSKQMHWITVDGEGTITPAGARADSDDAMNGDAVMYDVGKILTVGGATAYQNAQATRRAYVLDISGGPSQPVAVTRTGDLAYPRAFATGVALPDGSVLVLGGQQFARPFTDTGAALPPELWNPATGKFTSLAPDASPRTYHSVAVLLPDGRVFSGGGGLCGTCTVNHPDGRIFTPPYLLNADGTARPRPSITAAPATAAPGAQLTVATDTAVTGFALVRASSVTHTVNTDQRRIPLTPVASSGTTYTLQVPADTGVVVPGPYLLFALDAAGTPSVARYLTIG
jgi:galactose oxidase